MNLGAGVDLFDAGTQQGALRVIGDLIRKSIVHPTIRELAVLVTQGCGARNDECELEAIYNAVKDGDQRLSKFGLQNGVRYVADARAADTFLAAYRMIQQCQRGACAGDCDDHTIMVAALAGAIGFRVGARAWGPNPNREEYVHVYGVALLPKRGPWKRDQQRRFLESDVYGLDTSADIGDAGPGWQPPRGRVMTLWLE